jgi:hypothetical protein
MSAPQESAAWTPLQRTDYEEFLHTPVGVLRRYVDRDSRPLCGEAIVDDPQFRKGIEQRSCPYAGSRRGHPLPMNASALKQMTRNWDEILATANALRTLFAEDPPAAAGSLASGMRVAYAGICLPLFLLYRATEPMGDGQVPGFVSGLHKASIDIATSVQLMLVEGFKEGDPQALPSESVVQGILDFVEREGLLVGQKGVCAGPPQLIRELLDVMVHGRGRRLSEKAASLDELGDLAGVVPYVDELMKIWIAKHLVIAHNARLMDTLEERAMAMGVGGLRAADVDAGIREHRVRESHPVLVSNVIARQERASRSLDSRQYERLLRTIEEAGESLRWTDREPADLLLEHARTELGGEEQEATLPKVRRIVNEHLDDRVADLAIAALLNAARMEQLALRFFASTEASIKAALGLSRTSRSLSSKDLASVFGVTPRQYLGGLLGIDGAVDTDRIVLRAPRGVFVL